MQNKINLQMEEESLDFYECLEKYYDSYKPSEMRNREIVKTRKRYIQFGIFVFMFTTIVLLYRK